MSYNKSELFQPQLKNAGTHHTWMLFGLLVVMSCMGLYNLYSATAASGAFYGQVKNLGLGVAFFLFFGWILPLRLIHSYAYALLVAVIAALVVVLVMGRIAGGAQRWLHIGPIGGQPSELAKIAVAFAVAKFFTHSRTRDHYTLREIAPIFFTIILVFILIFKQPDFGTAGVALGIGFCQLAFVRIKIGMRMAFSMLLSIVLLACSGWFVLLRPYQKLRILNFLDPSLDPMGSGYNSIQSLIAIGSGGLWGKGFQQGTQTQLQFLPARQTDFIFSVFAEEQGFWGCILVFVLFTIFAYIALEISRGCRDGFHALLAIGMASLMYVEFAINVAMVIGIFPVVGVPLPFFSHGGSALLTACSAMGILVALDRDNVKALNRRKS